MKTLLFSIIAFFTIATSAQTFDSEFTSLKVDTIDTFKIDKMEINTMETSIFIKEYFNKNWDRTSKDSATFYREITYKNGKPFGKVYDYYINGNIQWEGQLSAVNPDIKEGLCIWYGENGQVIEKGEFKGDIISGEHIMYSKKGEIEELYSLRKGEINFYKKDDEGNLRKYKTREEYEKDLANSEISANGLMVSYQVGEYRKWTVGAIYTVKNTMSKMRTTSGIMLEMNSTGPLLHGYRIGAWANRGLSMGLNLIYNTNYTDNGFSIRPEIGWGKEIFSISYAYNLALYNKNLPGLNVQLVEFKLVLPFYPNKTSKFVNPLLDGISTPNFNRDL